MVKDKDIPFDKDVEAAIWQRLVDDGFSGPYWEAVADRLVRFGHQCVGAWVHDRTIFGKCRRSRVRGLGDADDLDRMSPPDIEELVQATVAAALLKLAGDGLQGRGWDVEGGRSIRSYFIQGCIFAFPAAYRGQSRRLRSRAAESVTPTGLPVERSVGDFTDEVDAAIDRNTEISRIVDPDLRTAVTLALKGYTYAEISAVLCGRYSTKKVKTMVEKYFRNTRNG